MKQKFSAVVVLIFCLGLYLQARQNPPKITLVPVAGPVDMLQGSGGNIGIVADAAGMLMIDAMFERVTGEIREAIKSLPGGDRVRVLLNTHWHADHTDGNKAFGPGAVIVAHENVRALLANDQALMGGQTKALPASALPGVTFSDKLTVYAGGETIRLVHFPHAHTDGDTVVFLDGLKVVHMGDMFFNGMFPFLDVANGGDIDNWVRQLDLILGALPADTKVIPGHGPLAGVAELKAFRGMLAASADLVRKQMKAGKTLDEIKAAGVPDSLAAWANGFMKAPQWLELVYRSLNSNPTR
ncbi:MAG: MBL fold metallo-hydrolase [Acidobacteria bacterium]|nr:MBL fold metallo-hydrolase [Acidobacteriota bacterium]